MFLSTTPGDGGSSSRSYRGAPSVALTAPQGQQEKFAKVYIIKLHYPLPYMLSRATPVAIGGRTEAIEVQLVATGVRLVSTLYAPPVKK